MMRTYFYILTGIISALFGWNLGHLLLTDLGILKPFPEIILFPCIALSLSVGMVLTEILISNPTRPKLSLQKALIPVSIAAGCGILAGLTGGSISQMVLLPQIRIDPRLVRIVGWLLIGSSTGLAEGITWRWHSIEAGDSKRFRQRFINSVIGSIGASLSAALIFEILRQIGAFPPEFKGAEDPVGFSILGMLLGAVFSISTSPSYMAALRAGAGFEYTGPNYDSIDQHATIISKSGPWIDLKTLKFVSESNEQDQIEEGLSIQLPQTGIIRVGSAEKKANICIPGLPLHSADIKLEARDATLTPNPQFFHTVEVNGERLNGRKEIKLKHNSLITFYTLNGDGINDKKYYRFVYYNRFLDPQA